MRYFIEIAYNGKNYHGWQNQPDTNTVQQTIETALSTILRNKTEIVGAGRTDTGVHARQLFAHFDFFGNIQTKELVFKLNSFLPESIAINSIFQVNESAHARFDAVSRTYEYRLCLEKDPFSVDQTYQVYNRPDIQKMNHAAAQLLQYKDFQCFSKSKTDVKTYNCKIEYAHWSESGNEYIFTITADRFLRNMVRAIVGTLLDAGYNKISLEAIHDIIKSKDRGNAGTSVPARGLFLTKVVYPENIKI